MENLTFSEVVTYILVPLAGAAGAIWTLVKVIIPRIVEARIEGDKDAREHQQRMDELQVEYLKAEGASTHQMMGSLLEKSQDKEARAYEFITQTVFNALDIIKTNVRLLPEIHTELKALKYEIRNLATHQRLLRTIVTKDADEDYRKSSDLQPETEGDDGK
jgi:hypothetical protein